MTQKTKPHDREYPFGPTREDEMTTPSDAYALARRRLRWWWRQQRAHSLRGRWSVFTHRIQNRWWDARAVLAGYCNDCPWSLPGEGGGYSHWRCALDRGHDGLHRARNYVWTDDGRTDYLPVPTHIPLQQQPWERNGTHTMRMQRRMRRWYREQTRKRLADNQGSSL